MPDAAPLDDAPEEDREDAPPDPAAAPPAAIPARRRLVRRAAIAGGAALAVIAGALTIGAAGWGAAGVTCVQALQVDLDTEDTGVVASWGAGGCGLPSAGIVFDAIAAEHGMSTQAMSLRVDGVEGGTLLRFVYDGGADAISVWAKPPDEPHA